MVPIRDCKTNTNIKNTDKEDEIIESATEMKNATKHGDEGSATAGNKTGTGSAGARRKNNSKKNAN